MTFACIKIVVLWKDKEKNTILQAIHLAIPCDIYFYTILKYTEVKITVINRFCVHGSNQYLDKKIFNYCLKSLMCIPFICQYVIPISVSQESREWLL